MFIKEQCPKDGALHYLGDDGVNDLSCSSHINSGRVFIVSFTYRHGDKSVLFNDLLARYVQSGRCPITSQRSQLTSSGASYSSRIPHQNLHLIDFSGKSALILPIGVPSGLMQCLGRVHTAVFVAESDAVFTVFLVLKISARILRPIPAQTTAV